jgi:[acyl-carrier-protein] S-malonyltransferase
MTKVAFVFPGGGSQYVGMGKSHYDNYPVARSTFEEASNVLGYDLAKLCFNGDLEKLSQMNHSQPAIFTASVSAYRVLVEETGITPAYAAGHSLGEYSALCCAGSLSFSEAISLVHERGILLQQVGNDEATMMAINKVAESDIREACRAEQAHGGKVYIAVFNSSMQHVIAGYKKDLLAVALRLVKLGAEINLLNINTASHCPLMLDASEHFRQHLLPCKFRPLNWPVVSNLDAIPIGQSNELGDVLVRHMIQPVRWHESVKYMIDHGVDCFIELGPQAVLTNLLKHIDAQATAYAYDNEEESKTINEILAPADYMHFIKKCMVAAVSTRNYNFNEQEYKAGVIEQYEALKAIREKAKHSLKSEMKNQAREALQILTTILDTKKTPDTQKKILIDEALSLSGISSSASL